MTKLSQIEQKSRKKYNLHGKKGTKVYKTWHNIKSRCYNPNSTDYKYYGGKGVTMSEEWKDFSKFYSDMGDPKDNESIDRIDSDKGYSKENCRWATMKVQQNNKKNNKLLTYGGKTQNISRWAEELGIKRHTLTCRVLAGWEIERAFIPPKPRKPRKQGAM